MSALLDKPKTSPAPSTATATPRVVHRPIAVPAPQPRTAPIPQAPTKPRALPRSSVASRLLAKAALFAVVAGATYSASSLWGQVMVESARQQRIEAKRRAMDAMKEEAILKNKVGRLTSAAEIEGWALSRNFIAPDGLLAKHGGSSGGDH